MNKHKAGLVLCGVAFLFCIWRGVLFYENAEVHWAKKDTAFIWLEGCQLIETCDGYQETLKKAMQDSIITNREFWKLEEIYNDGYDKYRMERFDL